MTTLGIKIEVDQEYCSSPIGEQDIIDEERQRFADGTWTPYGLIVVSKCEACGCVAKTSTDVWGVVVDTTTLVDSVVWEGSPDIAGEDYLAVMARELIDQERADPTERRCN